MTKRFVFLFFIFYISLTTIGGAEENLSSNTLKNPSHGNNPFMPQLPLPKDVVKPVEPAKPVAPKPLVIAQAPPAPAKPPAVVITGLIWNSDRPQAIINGQVVDIGDNIGEMEIVSINKTGIDLLYQGEKITLTP